MHILLQISVYINIPKLIRKPLLLPYITIVWYTQQNKIFVDSQDKYATKNRGIYYTKTKKLAAQKSRKLSHVRPAVRMHKHVLYDCTDSLVWLYKICTTILYESIHLYRSPSSAGCGMNFACFPSTILFFTLTLLLY